MQKDAGRDLEVSLQGTLAFLAQALKPAHANKYRPVSDAAELSLHAHGPARNLLALSSACPSLIVCLRVCDREHVLVAVLAA